MSQKTSHDKEIAEIWKLFRETARQAKETDRKIKALSEDLKETDRQLRETDRRLRKVEDFFTDQLKETNKRLRKTEDFFTGQWGKFMEVLVEGDLIKLLQQRNIKVDDTCRNVKGSYREKNWEIDILATNSKELVLVEVKTTLTFSHVKDFMKKLRDFTTWKPKYKGDKIYGAVAYLKANQSADVYAEKNGLFVIRAVGSSASITNSKNFKPKVFS